MGRGDGSVLEGGEGGCRRGMCSGVRLMGVALSGGKSIYRVCSSECVWHRYGVEKS